MNIPFLKVPDGTYTFSRRITPVPDALKSLGLEETVDICLNRQTWSHAAETLNKYLRKEHKRLAKLAIHNPIGFWKRATFLISHSDAFLFAALTHVRPKWFEGDAFPRVIDWLWSAQRARKSWTCKRGLKRFRPIIACMELDKPEGGKREISSPKIQGRLLLYLWNYCLSMYLDRRLPENFHGHRKGHGTPTAWAQILKNMDEYQYIWEFDLHKFHDSISQGLIMEALLQAGIPFQTASYIIDLTRAQTVLDAEETHRRRLLESSQDPEASQRILDIGPGTGMVKYVQARGTPQGVSTSAILATWCLYHLGLSKDPDYMFLSYADDGLVFSNREDPDDWLMRTLNTPKSGIRIKALKTAWIKKAGVWVSDLQFLGLRLDRTAGRVYASSRTGRNDGLYFNVGDAWLSWLKKVNLKDLVVNKQSPGRVKADMQQEHRLSPDRLNNLPVAIARLFWAGELYEAFAGSAPPWPCFHGKALKVALKDLYTPGHTADGEAPLYWNILLQAFRVLSTQVGERVHEPHTKYAPRNTKLWPGDKWAEDIGLFYIYVVGKDGTTTMTYGSDPAPAVQAALKEVRKTTTSTWPVVDYYKRHWVHYKHTPFRFPGAKRDKWASVVQAT